MFPVGGEVDGCGVGVVEDFCFPDAVGVGSVVGLVGEDVSDDDMLEGCEEGVVVSGEEDRLAEAREEGAAKVAYSSV